MIELVLEKAATQYKTRRQAMLYARDPEAWIADVLGKRLTQKQLTIATSVNEHVRTAVKSANGTGKSQLASYLGSWWCSTQDPYETTLMVSAPTYAQVQSVLFRYMQENFRYAEQHGYTLPGWMTMNTEWKYGSEGKLIAMGRRPSDRDIVSTFQGIHDRNVMVILDEGGGIPEDLYTAAEAVTTQEHARILTIGNPDRLNTPFHEIFRNTGGRYDDWNRETISAYDLPTFTGEIVYPDADEQKNLLARLTSKDWVEHKIRAWGVDSARFKAKVLGEFPDADDTSFFSQNVMDKAKDVELPDDVSVPMVIGVDLARYGDDDSVAYGNRGGHIRRLGAWSHASGPENVNRIHELCLEHGATQVRIDAVNIGGPILDGVVAVSEGRYDVIAMVGNEKTPDPLRWANAKAAFYDLFREQMGSGEIDLDPDDTALFKEMEIIQYDFDTKGRIQIESKRDIRRRGIKSPDSLEAAIYAAADLTPLLEDDRLDVGDLVEFEYDRDDTLYDWSY